MHKERVLNLARALEEGPQDKAALQKFFKNFLGRETHFDMSKVTHPCGTPACVWGHYVARGDLQQTFKPHPESAMSVALAEAPPDAFGVYYGAQVVRDHFGLSLEDLERLFAAPHDACNCEDDACNCDDDDDHDHHNPNCIWHGGCGGAETPEEAVAYIRAFVAKREAEGQ